MCQLLPTYSFIPELRFENLLIKHNFLLNSRILYWRFYNNNQYEDKTSKRGNRSWWDCGVNQLNILLRCHPAACEEVDTGSLGLAGLGWQQSDAIDTGSKWHRRCSNCDDCWRCCRLMVPVTLLKMTRAHSSCDHCSGWFKLTSTVPVVEDAWST